MSDDRTASLRALIQDRKSKELRRTYTHTFCLQPDLVLEYHVIESDKDDLERELRRLTPDDPEKPNNSRMVNVPKMKLEKSIKEKQAEMDALQAKIESVSVKVRFKTTKPGRYPEMQAAWDAREAKMGERFKETLLETFDRFIDPENMDKDDFVRLLEVFDEGEYFSAAGQITTLISHTVNVPKFGKPSTGRRK
jgi:hypothetical protein